MHGGDSVRLLWSLSGEQVSTTVNIADITSDLILTGQNTAEPKLSVEIASLQLEVGAVLTVDCGLHEYQHDHVNTGHTGHTGHQCHTCSADTGPNLSRTRGQIQRKNSQPLFAASRSQWRFGKWLN